MPLTKHSPHAAAQWSMTTDLLCAAVAGTIMLAGGVPADAAPIDLSRLAPDFAFIQHARAPSTDDIAGLRLANR